LSVVGCCALASHKREIALTRPSATTRRGFAKAVEDPGLAEGVNVYNGAITYKAVAESQGREYAALSSLM